MEYLDGGEVWSYLQDEKTKSSVGCYKSLGRFWIAEAINALEYMHRFVIYLFIHFYFHFYLHS